MCLQFVILIIECINIKNNKVKPFMSLIVSFCSFNIVKKKVETEKANTRIWFVSVPLWLIFY